MAENQNKMTGLKGSKGTQTTRRVLHMARRFGDALDAKEKITTKNLMREYNLSNSTIKRFISLYRDEMDNNFIYDPKMETYARIQGPDNYTEFCP